MKSEAFENVLGHDEIGGWQATKSVILGFLGKIVQQITAIE